MSDRPKLRAILPLLSLLCVGTFGGSATEAGPETMRRDPGDRRPFWPRGPTPEPTPPEPDPERVAAAKAAAQAKRDRKREKRERDAARQAAGQRGTEGGAS